MPHQAAAIGLVAALMLVVLTGMAPALDALRGRPGGTLQEVSGPLAPVGERGIEVDGHPVTLHGLEPLNQESRAKLLAYVASHGGALTCREIGRRRYGCRTQTGWDPAASLLLNGEIRTAVDAPPEYLQWELTARRGRIGIWQAAKG